MRNIAGIVLYSPQAAVIDLLQSLRCQGCFIYLYINQLSTNLEYSLLERISDKILLSQENVGLAVALNAIVQEFMLGHYDNLFLFDQDSQVHCNYIHDMTTEYGIIRSIDDSIVCLAPSIVDIKNQNATSCEETVSNIALTRSPFPTAATSGCHFTKYSFERVGLFDHNLFIDGIDHEWCLRAWMKQSSIHFSSKILLYHNIGDRLIKIRSLLKPYHLNPIRHYYIVRNSIYLILWKNLPLDWKCREVPKTIRRVIAYPILSTCKVKTILMISLAIRDGIIRKMGKCRYLPH